MIKSINACGDALLLRLRTDLKGLCAEENIILTAPYFKSAEHTVGICLYEIQDFSMSQNQLAAYTADTNITDNVIITPPPKLIELGYIIYVNETSQFGDYRIRRENEILTAVISSVYGKPYLTDGGAAADESEETHLRFSFLDTETKTKIWQSFSKPLQPAIYLDAGPIPIYGGEVRTVPAVKESERDIRHKN
jgi:hypothetical protein